MCLRADERAITSELLSGVEVKGRAVLFSTGWDGFWRTDRYGDPDHPCLTDATADLLVEEAAALVGIDSVNIDDTQVGVRAIHTKLLAAGIPIVEHLTGLDQLVGRQFRFFAVPAKVSALGTVPVSAFAVIS